MALGPRLELRQSQSLVMTPQLQQAIRLLALSNLEVESFIAEEIEKNPLLESAAPDEPAQPAEAPAEAHAEADTDDFEFDDFDAAPTADTAGGEAALDVDHDGEDFHQDSAADRMSGGPDLSLGEIGGGGHESAGEAPDFDAFEGGSLSLHEHLVAQAGEALSDAALMVAEAIIDGDRRDRLFHRPPSHHRPAARRPARRCRIESSPSSTPSIRPASAPATSPNASRCRRRRRTATIRRWRG